MLLSLLVLPWLAVFLVFYSNSNSYYNNDTKIDSYPTPSQPTPNENVSGLGKGVQGGGLSDGYYYNMNLSKILFFKRKQYLTLVITSLNLLLSLVIFGLFNFSATEFQFVQEHYNISNFDIYLGADGISIYFILLTTGIIPIALISSWNSIYRNLKSFLITLLLVETLLLSVFLALDILLFYIFFESILIPLFLLIGLFGSANKVRASFYLFLYTLLGSLFLLLAILTISSTMGTTDYDAIFKTNFSYSLQVFLFIGVFVAIAIKTPVYFLNIWLLKAHVESPLAGSIILAGIVLKLSLYGVFRLILPILPKVSFNYTNIVFIIGVITVIYASLSTLRTSDIKELIAYSSVSHAAIYLLGVLLMCLQLTKLRERLKSFGTKQWLN